MIFNFVCDHSFFRFDPNQTLTCLSKFVVTTEIMVALEEWFSTKIKLPFFLPQMMPPYFVTKLTWKLSRMVAKVD